jgi:hypothetical protein
VGGRDRGALCAVGGNQAAVAPRQAPIHHRRASVVPWLGLTSMARTSVRVLGSYGEDECRIRQGHAAENFARLSRIALNLLKAETTNRRGIKTKRLCCGWNNDYLLKVMTGGI